MNGLDVIFDRLEKGIFRHEEWVLALFAQLLVPRVGNGIHVVGANIALINDLYGLRKDVLTSDVNIILKHQAEKNCSLLEDSVAWAMEEVVERVRQLKPTMPSIQKHWKSTQDCHGLCFGKSQSSCNLQAI